MGLLNQVKNLENQMQMAQSQTMGINSTLASNPMMGINAASNPMLGVNTNLLTMLNKMQSKGSKPMKSEKFGARQTKKSNTSLPGNANITNLIVALTGNATGQEERGRSIWVTGLPESFQDATKLMNVFGNFGNVRKVVFTEKKPDGALIELDDSRGSVKAVAIMRS